MGRWIFRLFFLLPILLVAASSVFWALEIYPRRGSHPPLRLAQGTLAIQHTRIYVSPDDPPIDDGTVLIRDEPKR
jgi:hypothetical protein